MADPCVQCDTCYCPYGDGLHNPLSCQYKFIYTVCLSHGHDAPVAIFAKRESAEKYISQQPSWAANAMTIDRYELCGNGVWE